MAKVPNGPIFGDIAITYTVKNNCCKYRAAKLPVSNCNFLQFTVKIHSLQQYPVEIAINCRNK